MTPDDFPTREKYLAYVRECEDSIIYADIWGENRLTFEEATEGTDPEHHYSTCMDPEGDYCWCMPDEDGLRYYPARGMVTATHVTDSMFGFKIDHNYEEETCGWCRPEKFYWDSRGRSLGVKRAEARWWQDHHSSVLYSVSEYLGLNEIPPPLSPSKIGSHP